MSRRFFRSLIVLLFFSPLARGQDIEVTVQNGASPWESGSATRIPLQWPKEWLANPIVRVKFGKDTTMLGQLVEPSFISDTIKAESGKVRKDLLLQGIPMKPGEKITYSIPRPTPLPNDVGPIEWTEQPGESVTLSSTDARTQKTRPILRYMCTTYDPVPKKRVQSYKVFHHLFDPTGAQLVTNGGQTDDFKSEKDLVFPHHRGLMYGFNKCTYDGKTADTWHCTGETHVSHQKTIFQTVGVVSAEHRVLLHWHGPKNEVFAEEERQVAVLDPLHAHGDPKSPGTLVEFSSRLTTKIPKVRLDGDPQHAGFQFRAHNDVAKKTAKETYYLRPDGKGKPGETRNWDPKNKGPVNLPWDVLSFVLDGKRYSVAYIDHPNNPGEKRYSERDYGRFGCYFEYDLTPENPLVVTYRVWLQEGEMTAEQAERLRRAFVDPPRVVAK